MIQTSRRGILRGLIAAPAVIMTPGLLMPVRSFRDAAEDYDLTLPPGAVGQTMFIINRSTRNMTISAGSGCIVVDHGSPDLGRRSWRKTDRVEVVPASAVREFVFTGTSQKPMAVGSRAGLSIFNDSLYVLNG